MKLPILAFVLLLTLPVHTVSAKIGGSDVPDNMLSLLSALRATNPQSKKAPPQFNTSDKKSTEQDYLHTLEKSEKTASRCESSLANQLQAKSASTEKLLRIGQSLSELERQRKIMTGYLLAVSLSHADATTRHSIEQILSTSGETEELSYSLSKNAIEANPNAKLSLTELGAATRKAEHDCD